MWKFIRSLLIKWLQIISPSEYILTGQSNGWIACGRCKRPVRQGKSNVCWYCLADLCDDCWEEFGHCGHKEADAANEYARNFDPDNPPNPLPRIPTAYK